jgi:hypothetical protein
LQTRALAALRRRALIGTIFAGHVVELHLLQDNIFDQAKFRVRWAFDPSSDHDVLKHSTSWRLLSREEELTSERTTCCRFPGGREG